MTLKIGQLRYPAQEIQRKKKNEENLTEPQKPSIKCTYTIKCTNIGLMGVSNREERNKGTEKMC